MQDRYDVIVIGLGGMGSAALYHLSARGHRVLGLEAFERGHARGSSHGRSRIIREAYAEGAGYVPFVQRAFALWEALEAEAERPLLRMTGGLSVGPAESDGMRGVVTSAEQFGIPVERLSAAEANQRFPGFRVPEDLVALYQPRSGIVFPEACVGAHLDLAVRHGAVARYEEPVQRWRSDSDGVAVETNVGVYHADRLVITAGPWAARLLPSLGVPLDVVRQVNIHVEPLDPALYDADRCPVFIWQVPEGEYYGIPFLEGDGVKFGRHDAGQPCDPDHVDRVVQEDEVAALHRVLARYLPRAAGQVLWSLTCLYTRSPDEHFIIDRHPEQPRVVFGCGFSGHGFKFASAVGEALADLATDRAPRVPLDFLSLGRFPRVR